MPKSKFSLASIDPKLRDLASRTDHKILARWAIDCAKRVLPHFEKERPQDLRPRMALETLEKWIRTGAFKMAEIRRASLASHAAAREAGEDNAARSAARAAGQAVATAHVRTHALGAAIYALQSVHRASAPSRAGAAVSKERDRQRRRLNRLREAEARRGERSPSKMKTKARAALSIDAALASCPTEVRLKLEKLRRAIRNAAPAAEETVAYRMPAFKLNGRPLVYFAAFKDHIGFFPTSSPIPIFKKDLADYKTSEGTIQFPLDRPIPFDLVRKIVRFRVKEIRDAAKS